MVTLEIEIRWDLTIFHIENFQSLWELKAPTPVKFGNLISLELHLVAFLVMRATREQCDRVKAQQKIIKVDAGEMTEVDKKSAFSSDRSEANR